MTSYSTEEQPSEENLAVFFDQLRKERGFGSFTIGSKSNSCCSRTLWENVANAFPRLILLPKSCSLEKLPGRFPWTAAATLAEYSWVFIAKRAASQGSCRNLVGWRTTSCRSEKCHLWVSWRRTWRLLHKILFSKARKSSGKPFDKENPAKCLASHIQASITQVLAPLGTTCSKQGGFSRQKKLSMQLFWKTLERFSDQRLHQGRYDLTFAGREFATLTADYVATRDGAMTTLRSLLGGEQRNCCWNLHNIEEKNHRVLLQLRINESHPRGCQVGYRP